MRVKHYAGAVLDVPEARAAKLVLSASWSFVDKPAEKSVEAPEPVSPIEDTGEDLGGPQELTEPQEETKPAPTIQEMRAWAIEQGIEGVKEKGKLSRLAIEAYMEAHKE